jgi:hypothetical protein
MTGAGGASDPGPDPLFSCGDCRAPMKRLALSGHCGSVVDLDLCARGEAPAAADGTRRSWREAVGAVRVALLIWRAWRSRR